MARFPKVGHLLALAGGLAAGGTLAYLYASRVETRRYQLEKVTITTYGGSVTGGGNGKGPITAPDARCLRVLHISDLHLCEPESHKIEFLKRITDAEYDMVVLTGDIFENESGLQYANQILSCKPKLGAYAVFGNHDYYPYGWFHKIIGRLIRKFRHPSYMRDIQPFAEALSAAGFTVLQNQSFTHHAEGVHVIGVDYPGISPSHLAQLARSAPQDCVVLCLQHVPQNLDLLPAVGVDVAFCGHTHGGQVRIPGYGAVFTDSELPQHEASGATWRDRTVVHVSRGISADPKTNFRLFCPPAATVVDIIHSPARRLEFHANTAETYITPHIKKARAAKADSQSVKKD